MGRFGKITKTAKIGMLASVLAGTVVLSAGAVGAAPAHRIGHGTEPALAVGTYKYTDNLNDSGEGLTLKSNGTVTFESGCKGIWVEQGSTIAMDINAGCQGSHWIFTGTVSAQGLSSKAHPGRVFEQGTGGTRTGTWFAVKL